MRQIIAMGGGGFSMEDDNPGLDQYILRQSDADKPSICFIPTASGDGNEYIEKFYRFFEKEDCNPSHLSLFNPPQNLREFVLDKDILYVGGGSTKNMLALWKEWGLEKIIIEAWKQGTVLAGLSAGAICWFQQGVTNSYGDKLRPIDCLGIIEGSCCPHYDGEVNRRKAYTKFITNEEIIPGYALDDGAALHVVEAKIHKAISSRRSAQAYYVYNKNGTAVEEKIPITYLS
ncbi:peptidase E [Halobacillus halophilus]|uniref:Type 1 glutamine amidotransferase-like domain-containing protein n=1 Tax=Halobacillus halophilus TaxID=1570 RepID=UPI001CD1D718|nr:peptidase E [Halobacillus halophilus]MCA1012443.1 peptidase E [Halobacillus halophilus]